MTCTVDGCNNQPKCRGMCSRHYQRWLDGKPLNVPRYWHPRADRYLDLMDLIDHGASPLEAAARIGVTVAAAARWFRRHGHIGLALAYEPAAKRRKVAS